MDENPLDKYSPFDQTDKDSTSKSVPTSSPTIGADPEDEEDIRAYEQRLNILESQLNSQESILNSAQDTGVFEPPPNWPKFYPMVHFDIEEVPEQLRKFVSLGLYAWCLMAISFGLNWLGCLTLLHAGDSTDSPGSKIALSSLYLFIVVPLDLDLGAMAIYRVLKSDNASTLSYMKMFAALGITVFFEGLLALGLESSGSCGLITTISLFMGGHVFLGLFSTIITASLSYTSYTQYKLLKSLWSYYKGTEQGENIQDNMKKTVAMMVVDSLK